MALTTTGGSLGAANAAVSVDVEQNSTFSGVVTGTFVGTVTFQALYDPTEGWVAAQTFTRPGVTAAAALTAPGNRIINTGGAIAVRAAMTAYTSGTAVVTLAGTPAASGASSGGGGGGGAVTVADGADVAQGTTTDAGIITDTSGTVIGFLRGAILRWNTYLARIPAALTGSGNFKVALTESTASQAITAASLPLPTNAATDRTTAAAPASVELSDGAAFYTGAKTGQLPTALVSARLDVNLGAAPATITAQGAAATGTAPVGNPVYIGGLDPAGGTTVNPLQVQSAVSPNLRVGLYQSGLQATVNAPSADGISAATNALFVVAAQTVYNGTSMDRQRNNVEATFLASAGRTTTQVSTAITTYNAGAITVILDMTTVGTGSVTLSIDGVEAVSGNLYNLLTGAAVVTNVRNVYVVDPTIPAVANVSAQKRLPRTIKITTTANNANSAVYSVSYVLQPT